MYSLAIIYRAADWTRSFFICNFPSVSDIHFDIQHDEISNISFNLTWPSRTFTHFSLKDQVVWINNRDFIWIPNLRLPPIWLSYVRLDSSALVILFEDSRNLSLGASYANRFDSERIWLNRKHLQVFVIFFNEVGLLIFT